MDERLSKSDHFPALLTERLMLRELNIDDAPEIFILRSDEKHNEFIDRPRAVSIEDAEAFINKMSTLTDSNESFFWVISVKDEARLAGTIMLWNFDRQNKTAEIGYELLHDYQGKGFMTEAIAAVLDFGFRELDLSAIEACVYSGNSNSLALLSKFNFIRDEMAEKTKDAKELMYILTAADYLYR